MSNGQRRRVEDDDSLLASVAGVPLTRSARIGACLVWGGFWCARILLTDALPYINQGDRKSALLELLGENPFDQGFSICMAWLTVEVAVIAWVTVKRGGSMLIAKTTASFREQLIEELAKRMSLEELEAIVEKKRKKAAQDKVANGKGKKG